MLSQDFSFFSQGFRVCPKISSFRPEIFKLLPQDFDLLPQTIQVFAPRFLKFVSRFSKLGKQVGGNINFKPHFARTFLPKTPPKWATKSSKHRIVLDALSNKVLEINALAAFLGQCCENAHTPLPAPGHASVFFFVGETQVGTPFPASSYFNIFFCFLAPSPHPPEWRAYAQNMRITRIAFSSQANSPQVFRKAHMFLKCFRKRQWALKKNKGGEEKNFLTLTDIWKEKRPKFIWHPLRG